MDNKFDPLGLDDNTPSFSKEEIVTWRNFKKDEKGKVIIEHNSPFILGGMILSGFATFSFTMATLSVGDTIFKFLMGIFLILTLFFLYLKLTTSYFWIFDILNKKIIFSKTIFGKSSEIEYADFNDMSEFGVNSISKVKSEREGFSGDGRTIIWHEYWTELLLKNGQVIKFSKQFRGKQRVII